MDVHHRTADRFVDEIFGLAVQSTAERTAQQQSQIKAGVLDRMVAGIEHKNNSSETVVGDLVADFLLPEVERRRLKAEGVFACCIPSCCCVLLL